MVTLEQRITQLEIRLAELENKTFNQPFPDKVICQSSDWIHTTPPGHLHWTGPVTYGASGSVG